ncbi:MAG: hypothetical protein ABGY30_12620, partial [Acidimicrobiales bacterium]
GAAVVVATTVVEVVVGTTGVEVVVEATVVVVGTTGVEVVVEATVVVGTTVVVEATVFETPAQAEAMRRTAGTTTRIASLTPEPYALPGIIPQRIRAQ